MFFSLLSRVTLKGLWNLWLYDANRLPEITIFQSEDSLNIKPHLVEGKIIPEPESVYRIVNLETVLPQRTTFGTKKDNSSPTSFKKKVLRCFLGGCQFGLPWTTSAANDQEIPKIRQPPKMYSLQHQLDSDFFHYTTLHQPSIQTGKKVNGYKDFHPKTNQLSLFTMLFLKCSWRLFSCEIRSNPLIPIVGGHLTIPKRSLKRSLNQVVHFMLIFIKLQTYLAWKTRLKLALPV